MRPSLFMTVLILLAATVSALVYIFIFGAEQDAFGLNYIYKGGPLVIVLMILSIMVVTFIFERILSLRKAYGAVPVAALIKELKAHLEQADFERAAETCRKQGGSCGRILLEGVESFARAQRQGLHPEKALSETRRAIEEATSLEVPQLEKNLIALSTIASVSTMVGLLGTTIGMIRAFKALAQAGAPDAIQLSVGISEALINTAGGLAAAIMAIVAYNYFVNKVDSYMYEIEEAGIDMVALLSVSNDRSKA